MKSQNPYQYDDSDINDHFEIDYLLETESTNDEIASLEMNHTRPWKVVVAEKQSAGKGRLGRIWESPPHKNLYFSIKIPLKNNFKVEQSALANLVAALSLYKTLSNFHIPSLRIKWPNDLYIKNKKIAGILSELIQKEEHYYFIIGVGLNVN